jgi:uncharacterized protein
MSATGRLVVSVHDVAPPQWDRVRRMLDALTAAGVSRRSLLVIPNFQGRWGLDDAPDFVAHLQRLQDDGDEMVLHGYEHVEVAAPRRFVDRVRNRWFTRHEGEFLALDYPAARDRLERGLAMARRARLDMRGFIAPAWLLSAAGLQAARDCGFEYTNSYFTFADLIQGRSHVAPSLVFGPGHLNEDVGIAVQERVSTWLARSRVVRVALHPPCIDHADRFERILSMIRAQLAEHRPVTYLELLAHWRQRSRRAATDGDAHAS